MSTISAGQLMQSGEVQALYSVTAPSSGVTSLAPKVALLTTAATGALNPANTTFAGASIAEYVATGYARQSYGPGAPSAASPSVVSNSGTITFGPFTTVPSSPNNVVTWAVICDSTSGSSSVIYAALLLTVARTPLAGDSLQAAASAFAVTLT